MAEDAELAYYRAVEDLFAAQRGVPHVLSARDFQLLRSWWRDAVPLEAVGAGVREALARRAERGEDPVVSLSYCRHAVRRHARRLAEMRAGSGASSAAAPVEGLVEALHRAAAGQAAARPAVGRVLHDAAIQLESLRELPPEAVEGALWDLETSLLEACRRALPPDERAAIEQAAAAAAEDAGATDRARVTRAHSDRLLRQLLALPRLELA